MARNPGNDPIRMFFNEIECIVSEPNSPIIGRTNTRQNSPIQDMGSGRYSSSVPPHRELMDEKTPCIAEAARRLLKTEGCTLEVTPSLSRSANELALHISDSLPSLIREPDISSEVDWTFVCIKADGHLIARLGGHEPSLDACWIPNTGEGIENLWTRFIQNLSDLMIAGYPGCVGCGGPGSEGVWDETASRARTRGT